MSLICVLRTCVSRTCVRESNGGTRSGRTSDTNMRVCMCACVHVCMCACVCQRERMCAQPWCWAEQSSRDTRRVHTAVGGRPCASARHLSSVCVCVCVCVCGAGEEEGRVMERGKCVLRVVCVTNLCVRRRRREENDGKRKEREKITVVHWYYCPREQPTVGFRV